MRPRAQRHPWELLPAEPLNAAQRRELLALRLSSPFNDAVFELEAEPLGAHHPPGRMGMHVEAPDNGHNHGSPRPSSAAISATDHHGDGRGAGHGCMLMRWGGGAANDFVCAGQTDRDDCIRARSGRIGAAGRQTNV